MIITGTHLPRRTFLRGLGAAVALPMLDAMTPALAKAAPAAAGPKRLVFTYVPNGVSMAGWTPTGAGAGFELSTVLKPLAAHRSDMLVLSGLAQRNGMALGDGPGDHARAAASYLTGVHPKKTSGADIHNGISADQIVAQSLAKETRFSSIEIGCDDSRTVGNCDSGYSCAYTNSLAWRSESSPMPPETNPRLVFERLFGADAHLDPATRQRRMLHRRSILDLVGERTKQLTGTLGASDRRKVDEYLHAVREIERQIEVAESDMRDLRPGIDKPTGIPVAFADYVKLMYDLQVVAFQTDLTRVVTMMVGREGSMRTYPEIGVPDPHHPLTHHRNNKDWMARVEQINVFHAELFNYFIEKMKATKEGDSNLLERSMVVYGSGLSDGNRHTHEDLPVLIMGQGGGLLKTGRHVVYEKETPMNNLYLTLMAGMGVKTETLGDSTGELDFLTDVS
ncbi:MAG TPA: DUF1552 domain-containing protein [Luteitalea sp.]|nr:DUF1552 domain-containing protein [Luteitalea sp.]